MATQAFLINPRRRRKSARKGSGVATRTRTTSRRRTAARRKGVPAWVKAKGYSTWASYMASIRPNKKGGNVAGKRKRRRRRASASRPVARRRRRTYRRNAPVSYAANPRRRRRYRRNPIAVRGLMNKVTQAGSAAIGVMAGKAGARVGRSALKIMGGTPIGYAAEIGVGIAGGMVLEKFVSRNFAAMFLVGALVSVGEQIVKQFNIPVVSAALGDEGEGMLALAGDDDASRYLVGGYEQHPTTSDVGTYDLAEA